MARREAGPLLDRVADIHHISRAPAQVSPTTLGHVTRMAALEVVGDPPADPVELDAADDPAPCGSGSIVQRQHFRGEHLQLQRHRQSVVGAPRAEAQEELARQKHRARGHGLEARSRSGTGIGLVGPGEPEALDLVLSARSSTNEDGLMPSRRHAR